MSLKFFKDQCKQLRKENVQLKNTLSIVEKTCEQLKSDRENLMHYNKILQEKREDQKKKEAIERKTSFDNLTQAYSDRSVST